MRETTRPGLSELTGEDCAEILRRLRRALQVARIDLDRMVLWHDLADVRWVSAFRGPVLRVGHGACSIDRARAERAFRDAVFMKRTALALERASGLPGYAAVVKHVLNWRLHPPVQRPSSSLRELIDQAGDHLYEIETGARLSDSMPRLSFGEPDLLCENPEFEFRLGLACKRPRSEAGFIRCVRKAAKQIRQRGTVGLALISADNLIDQTVRDRSGQDLKAECVRRIGRVIERHHAGVLGVMAEHPPIFDRTDPRGAAGFLGVIVTGSYLLMGRDGPDGPEFMNTAFVPLTVNNPEPRWAFEVLWALIHLIERGENALLL